MDDLLQWAIAVGLLLFAVAMVLENFAPQRDIPFIQHKEPDSAADRED